MKVLLVEKGDTLLRLFSETFEEEPDFLALPPFGGTSCKTEESFYEQVIDFSPHIILIAGFVPDGGINWGVIIIKELKKRGFAGYFIATSAASEAQEQLLEAGAIFAIDKTMTSEVVQMLLQPLEANGVPLASCPEIIPDVLPSLLHNFRNK